MSRSLSINLYLRYFSIAIYGKFDLYYLRLFRLLVCRLYNVCISVFLIVTVYYYWLLLNLCCKVIFLKSLFLCTFWRLKVLVLWRKTVQNLLIFVYLFCPKNSTTELTKTFITQEWLVAESCPTPCWIAFLMLYRLVYNIHSCFIEWILGWSACFWQCRKYFLSFLFQKINTC